MTLKEWIEDYGDIIFFIGGALARTSDGRASFATQKPDLDTAEPVARSLELLDGSWNGDANFMIANVIAYATALHLPAMLLTKGAGVVSTAS